MFGFVCGRRVERRFHHNVPRQRRRRSQHMASNLYDGVIVGFVKRSEAEA